MLMKNSTTWWFSWSPASWLLLCLSPVCALNHFVPYFSHFGKKTRTLGFWCAEYMHWKGAVEFCTSTHWLTVCLGCNERFTEYEELLELGLEAQLSSLPVSDGLYSLLLKISFLQDPRGQGPPRCLCLHNSGKNSEGPDLGHVSILTSISLSRDYPRELCPDSHALAQGRRQGSPLEPCGGVSGQ